MLKRPIRSFVRREGRMTTAQKSALENLWVRYGIELSTEPLSFEELFCRKAMRVLEIGFGNGESLITQAQANPDQDFIGIEVHRPGVGHLLAKIHEHQLANIRIINNDAVVVLKEQIPNDSLDKIQVFFPDPWPKKRHHKRRLIQSEFVHLISTKLRQGGRLHLATDWQDYAEQMMSVMSSMDKIFVNIAGDGNYLENNSLRPKTKFEKRGERLGHGVWDLVFEKVGASN